VTLRHLLCLALLVPALASATPAGTGKDQADDKDKARWLTQAEAWVGRIWNRRDAASWLDQIGKALREQNYQGTLVMVAGGRIETLAIYHAYTDGVERERMVTLSGPRRELVRADQRVMLVGTQAGTSVAYDANPGGKWNPTARFADAARLEGYRAKLGRIERVAGYDTQVVELASKDGWRYGYRLWLERKTGLPLRLALLDDTRKTLEQVAFTELALGHVPSDRDLRPTTGKEVMQRVQTLEPGVVSDPGWRVNAPPPGFTLRSARRLGQAVQLLYGDGLASVSVYIEPAPPGAAGQSASRSGAVNAQAVWRGGRRVMAIGKVPAATVEHFARNVQHVPTPAQAPAQPAPASAKPPRP
jgi:sigma-E factor negative regulatory protein RseB